MNEFYVCIFRLWCRFLSVSNVHAGTAIFDRMVLPLLDFLTHVCEKMYARVEWRQKAIHILL